MLYANVISARAKKKGLRDLSPFNTDNEQMPFNQKRVYDTSERGVRRARTNATGRAERSATTATTWSTVPTTGEPAGERATGATSALIKRDRLVSGS